MDGALVFGVGIAPTDGSKYDVTRMATPIPRNRASFRLGEIARSVGGEVHDAAADLEVVGVTTDTRNVVPGNLFVALGGERFDGHRFVADALARGAVAALVGRASGATGPRIETNDPLRALGDLAQAHAAKLRPDVAVLSIGGAAGKTTTRALAQAVAVAAYGSVCATEGNLNNLIGVPMTLLGLESHHRAAVIECGTNSRGEIRRLGAIVGPDVALVLNTDAEHTEGLGSIEEAADEEADVLSVASRAVVLNRDDPRLLARRDRAAAPVFTFGEGEEADVRLVARESLGLAGSRVTFRVGKALGGPTERSMAVGIAGHAAALDAVAALAGVLALRGSMDALDAMVAAVQRVQPVSGRMVPRDVGPWLVLDDSYNANPRSMAAAFATASETARARKVRWMAVLGDMLELGALAESLHADVLRGALASDAAAVILLGPEFHRAGGTVRDVRITCAHSLAEGASAVRRLAAEGDVVLLKGSRGMKIDGIVALLTEEVR